MRYPIGIQTFDDLRTDGYVYVDKTALVYDLINSFRYVFLSRPRRFGKSLLLSTIKSYFQGKKEMFEGLAISDLENDWTQYPVIYIDLISGLYTSTENLIKHLNYQMSILEEQYGSKPEEQTISDRFSGIIRRAYQQTGQRVVILIDEYDKPLLETIGKTELQEQFRDELRALYGVMKSQDQYIRFVMLTGVTKFGHLNVFSGLNNIKDISFSPKYAAICGVTKDEIHRYFDEPLHEMAQTNGCSTEEMTDRLRMMYDGYRFTKSPLKVFNPFSLLNAFADQSLGDYWFASGTPKYLVTLLQMHHYDISQLEGETADESQLSRMDTNESADPIPVIYQSGYLTIKDYDAEEDFFTLGYPNEEVRKGFLKYLFPFYAQTRDRQTFDVRNFVRDIVGGKAEAFMQRLTSLTADISYDILAHCEDDFHNLLYIIFTLSSLKPDVERHTSNGRIDMVVETKKYVYVMEFKVDGTAQAAIDQINSKDYALPWSADHRQVIKIGANFSTTERRLTDYIIQ